MASERKAGSFLGGRVDELDRAYIETLYAELQSAMWAYHICWTKKYSNYVKTCNSIDIVEANFDLQARSMGLFLSS